MTTPSQSSLTLETVLQWARSGYESDKVYRFLFLHPEDFFTVPVKNKWPIAHQVIYNGDVFLLKRILALFFDEQINIQTLSKDDKTLLDVATNRKQIYPEMFNYIEQLFLQDNLIKAAKKNNWQAVKMILQQYPHLANEKPPYAAQFVLHYLVQYGDKDLLKEFMQSFRFDTNILDIDLETPFDIAKRLKRDHLCILLQSTTQDQSIRERFKALLVTSGDRTVNSTTSQCPYPVDDLFPRVDFGTNSLLMTDDGNYTLEKKTSLSTIQIALPPSKQEQQMYTSSKHDNQVKDTNYFDVPTNSEPPLTTPISSLPSRVQLEKNLTCPLTKQIMIDPVIANDGQTYEREAITEYVNMYHCSPMTGVPMDTTFRDNTEVKQIIQSMKKNK